MSSKIRKVQVVKGFLTDQARVKHHQNVITSCTIVGKMLWISEHSYCRWNYLTFFVRKPGAYHAVRVQVLLLTYFKWVVVRTRICPIDAKLDAHGHLQQTNKIPSVRYNSTLTYYSSSKTASNQLVSTGLLHQVEARKETCGRPQQVNNNQQIARRQRIAKFIHLLSSS